ncbi:MAG: hypothetical protein QW228_03145 [Candidatus Aenigmatarchaeota archaeon]
MVQSKEEIIEYIKTQLGYPVLTLETEIVNPNYYEYVIFTGNDTTTQIQHTVSDKPIASGSVFIKTILNNNGVNVESVLSDLNGQLTGSYGSGTVDYTNGNLEINYDYPVKAGEYVLLRYGVSKSDWIYNRSVQNALFWFTARRGLRKIKHINLVGGVDTYQIDTEPVVRISDVDILKSDYVFNYELFGLPLVLPWDNTAVFANWADYYDLLQKIKLLKRIYGRYYRYEFVSPNLLRIHPAPDSSGLVIVDYRVELTEDRLSVITPKEYFLVREYAYAVFLGILGRIRSKYTSFPVVGGETSFGDATDLIEKSAEMIERLNRDLADLSEPLPIFIG